MQPTYYDVLQVRDDASPEVIHAAYRALAKRYHPDSGGSEYMMKMLNRAYEVLSDPVARSEYDARRAGRSEPELQTKSDTRPQAVVATSATETLWGNFVVGIAFFVLIGTVLMAVYGILFDQ